MQYCIFPSMNNLLSHAFKKVLEKRLTIFCCLPLVHMPEFIAACFGGWGILLHFFDSCVGMLLIVSFFDPQFKNICLSWSHMLTILSGNKISFISPFTSLRSLFPFPDNFSVFDFKQYFFKCTVIIEPLT